MTELRLAAIRASYDPLDLLKPRHWLYRASAARYMAPILMAAADKDMLQGRLEQSLKKYRRAYDWARFVDHSESRRELMRKASSGLKKAEQIGARDPFDPISSKRGLAFIISYPRSGNTYLLNTLSLALRAQWFTALEGDGPYFTKRAYVENSKLVRVVKDHIVRDYYAQDKIVYAVRDGRDALISLCYFTLVEGGHRFQHRGELAAFIRFLTTSYPFGDWASHVRKAFERKAACGENMVITKYEDFVARPAELLKIAMFVESHPLLSEEVMRLVSESAREIRRKTPASEPWGLGKTFPEDSLFYAWSQKRGGSSWRDAFDAGAKRAFHETGATELLLELGYEKDPNWWKA